MEELKDILKKHRQTLGLSQVEIAEKLGIQQARYAFYETGRNKPKNDFFIKYKTVFDIDLINTNSDNSITNQPSENSNILSIQEARINAKRRWLEDKDKMIAHLEKEIEYLEADKEKMREHLENEIAHLSGEITDKNNIIHHFENEIKLLEEKLSFFEKTVYGKNAQLRQLPCGLLGFEVSENGAVGVR